MDSAIRVGQTQLALSASLCCPDCPADHLCGEGGTARGCLVDGPPDPNLLHPSKPDWLDRFTETNGFDLGTIQAVNQAVPDLPRYVPRIRLNADIADYSEVPAIALSLCEVERLAARVRERGIPAKALLGLPEDHLLVVLGFERDPYLERAWPIPRRRQILKAIQETRPDLAVAWGFSVWHRHVDGWVYPRVEQLYGIKRSLILCENLQRPGISAIPHLYWGDRRDLDRWGRWLEENPCVSTIAVDLQTTDSGRDWQAAMSDLAYLRGILSRGVRAFFNGPCAVERLRQVDAIWPGCSISSFGAYFSALYPFKRRYGLRAEWTQNPLLSRQAVFLSAADEYAAFLANPSGHRQPLIFGDGWSQHDARWTRGARASWPGAEYLSNGVFQLGLRLRDAELVGATRGAA